MSDNVPVAFDMYGQPIYPLGETGFGIAVWFPGPPHDQQTRHPYFTIFHQSDNYKQSLFSVLMQSEGPQIHNPFPDRIVEFFATQMSLLGAPHLREDRL